MKRQIYKVLAIICFCATASSAQAQRVPGAGKCSESVKEEIKVEVTEAVNEVLASLKSLESLENLVVLESLEELGNLKDLTSLAVLAEVQVPSVREPENSREMAVQPPFAHTKTKRIDRSFKVGRSDKLSIENQFGKVDVQTWAKNEVLVQVTIVTRAATEAKAQEILDNISIRVNEDRAGNLISFVTEREPMQIRNNTEKAFEINYVVKMPKGNPLRVANKYGSVQVPDFDGPTELEVRYGQLTTGSLNHAKNKIAVAYSGGVCELAYVKSGDLFFRYSSLNLGGANQINTTTGYSNIAIEKVNVLAMESRYDSKFHVGAADEISGSGSYSGIKIGNLMEAATLDLKYCSGFEIKNVGPNFRKLELTGGYTGMAVGFADNSAFSFVVDTQYGSFRLNQDLANFSLKEVKNTTGTYKGNYGKSSPKGTVNVSSRYGSIAFR